MNHEDEIRMQIETSIAVKRELLKNITPIIEVAEIMIEAYKNNKKVVWFGNGGSAADAQHLATELVSKFYMERAALPSMAFTTNTSTLTAISNDYDFNRIFERQVEAFVDEGDVVIGISTSGNSENVIRGLKKAKKMGAITVGLTGKTGGKMKQIVDYLIAVPSTETPRIQEAHIMIGHILCNLVEVAMFGKE